MVHLRPLTTHLTWTELIMLVNDRDGWRSRVRAINQPPRIETEICARAPGARIRKSSHKPNANKSKTATTTSNKYINRDMHELFFRPNASGPQHRYKTRSKKNVKPKDLTKPTYLTDKERAVWAREHYQMHHGSKSGSPRTSPPETTVAPKICSPVIDPPLSGLHL